MKIPVNEQETVINFSRNDGYAKVVTTDTTIMTKLDRKVAEKDSPWKLEDIETLGDDIVGKHYSCPKRLISFRGKTMSKKRLNI